MYILLFSLVFGSVASQILSCAEVDGCPMSPNNAFTTCELENHKVGGIGVSQINTTLFSKPLSWTIASYIQGQENNTMSLSRKDFYLGQPAGVDLRNNASIQGCAVFFEGISQALQFQSDRAAVGTCEDALTELCVKELIAQGRSILAQNASNIDCNSLATALQTKVLDVCPHWYGNWGLVTGHAITGSESPESIETTNCNPTISRDYTARRVESFNASMEMNPLGAINNFFYGITPIMTFLLPNTPGSDFEVTNTSLAGSEVHLNCLRSKANYNLTVPPQESVGNKLHGFSSTSRNAGIAMGFSAVVMAVLV